jgi:dTDP-4-amino-4,6-dideoxygalactose transaminase
MTALPDLSVDSDRIPFAKTEMGADAVTAAARVLASGWVTAGPEVVDFEREFAGYLGLRPDQAYAVSSCTAAIELALRGLGLPAGAKVLTPTITFCGAVHAIVNAGLEPVLVDCDPVTLAPDAATTARAAALASGVDAMVVLHFAGYPAPVPELAAAARLPLSRVVEDAAHAIGTWVGERPVGTISAATCFSFYATKNLPIGEGGMVTTTDPALADFVRRARLHGMSRDAWKRYLPGNGWRYAVETEGLKANMTDVQAAIGRAQLRRLDGWQARREELARRYEANLAAIGGIRPAARPAAGAGRHAWHLYVVQVEPGYGMGRDAVIQGLARQGVDCSVHFIPLHHQPYFRRLLGDQAGRFPAADAAFEQIVSLPFYPSLRDDQVDRVCEAIADLRLAAPIARARTAL